MQSLKPGGLLQTTRCMSGDLKGRIYSRQKDEKQIG